MNSSDSDVIRAIIESAGLKEVGKYKSADLIILNSCSIRQQAEDKLYGWGAKLKVMKNKPIVVLTGCMAVRHRGREADKYERKLKATVPWADFIIDIREIKNLPEKLGLSFEAPEEKLNVKNQNGLVPISSGCDNFCSYCIVPYARGGLVDFSYDQILNSVKKNIENGVSLIYLIGQNVNSWKGASNSSSKSFVDLLQDVTQLPGDFWVTFISSNPMDFTDELAEIVASNPKILKWVNLAVQSGSDRILKKMNRKYSVERFKEIAGLLRSKDSSFRLTTDIIVGFPGETEDDFTKTLELVKEMQFDMVYIGKYSPRKGTMSELLNDDIPLVMKKSREKQITELINDMRFKKHSELVGIEIKVLPLGRKRGFTYYNHEVIFEKAVSKSAVGHITTAKVIDSSMSGLVVQPL